MTVKQFASDERAVTPVIGIILIVAIVVVLAAVVGTSVLDIGQTKTTTSPQVSFTFEYDDGGPVLNATHESGDPVENPSSRLSVEGDKVQGNPDYQIGGDSELNSGDTIKIDISSGGLDSGDTIRIVFSDADTDTTSTLAEYEQGA